MREKNFRVERQPRIYAAKSTDKCLIKQVNNFGLYWEQDDCLRQVSTDAATDRACRGTFLRIIWEFFRHFFGPVLEKFTKYDCILEIKIVVQVRVFLQA